MTLWLLGDQLYPEAEPLSHEDHVFMLEAHQFGERLPYHPFKLTLVFSGMRHFRDTLREQGYEVTYLEAESFDEGLERYFAANPEDSLVLMRPPSHGAADRLEGLVEKYGGELTVVENDLFLSTREEWAQWRESSQSSTYRQEQWYRHMRRETGILMDGDSPIGGEWNFDDQNRETPPDGWTPPPVPEFDPDGITREVHAFVTDRYDGWGNEDLDSFIWPVTRAQALQALDHFVEVRLPEFGPYQDAMVDGAWALDHSLLSPAMNLGLIHPKEAIERVVSAYREREDLPINSVEGYVRQVLGWREFMRHVYREAMPGMDDANQLNQTRALPPLYYDGETEMRCMNDAVGHVWERGYAHHIERLMLLANFALIYGSDPHELNDWFHFGFVDAYHWVTTPNVVGMGSFATDILSSKPYASSANYINRMSDYCSSCPYSQAKTTGEDACPFNSLYWTFLKDNEELLRGTGRMGLVYSHVDRKDESEWEAIRSRAADVREQARQGNL